MSTKNCNKYNVRLANHSLYLYGQCVENNCKIDYSIYNDNYVLNRSE